MDQLVDRAAVTPLRFLRKAATEFLQQELRGLWLPRNFLASVQLVWVRVGSAACRVLVPLGEVVESHKQ
ncbi:hypothetical protein [Streptomyces sp. Ru87]|uniref:hypothetical protein n=1 Tax=Streptomyces sp. Ru87 TaxID=2044307 RepID=UPI00117C3644|nr:hypothetical protein [Streptomyces sp. Ru87]